MFMQISIIQWIFMIWILLLVLKSAVALFDKDAPDEILFGVLLILGGGLWILQHFGFGFYLPWIAWLKSFRYEILIAILLILYGLRLVFQAPWKHILVIIVAVLAFFTVSRITFPSHEYRSGYTRPHTNLATNDSSQKILYAGRTEDTHLELIMNRGNFSIKTEKLDSALAVSENEQIVEKGKNSYQISSNQAKGELLINQKISSLSLESKLGNLNGVLNNVLEKINASSNLGDIQLSFYEKVDRASFESNMGNITLDFHQGVNQIFIKSNAGNVNIYLPKGLSIETKGLDSRLGNLNISNGDGSQGIVQITGSVNLGNINIIADL